jgi:succinylglutamate desuccinylase
MPGMGYAIDTEIQRFEALLVKASQRFDVSLEVPYGGILTPKGHRKVGERDIGLTLMGLTHGNEWAGVAVLSGVLELLIAGALDLRIPVAFVLGNPWAAKQAKRFLERDLNRSFGRGSVATFEEKRALELEPLLARTAYLVDFHQTMQPTDRPFFIFPHRSDGVQLARAIAPHQTIVTHWGKSFSADGKCTDEYVNGAGGLGLTIELGQNGFDAYQIAVGQEAALWAIAVATARQGGMTLDEFIQNRPAPEPEIYTWLDIVPWPDRGVVQLDPGWTNFRKVEKGEKLGEVDGRTIYSRAEGRILFPKYLTPEQQSATTGRPAELIRVMRRVSLADLPKD